jgi:2-dehydro-3-deoxyglucarate aldolase/4-hydroxy-2-oxoheptanedioate aldolase
MKTSFHQRLRDGQTLVGILLTTESREVAEVIQLAGFEWVFIDMEHGSIEPSGAQGLLQALSAGPAALVRIPDNEPAWFKKVLDAGADGVIVPLVRSADDARRAVAAAKYPPLGNRSVGVGRAHGYGYAFGDYIARANAGVSLVLQIEHVDAVNQIEDILAVPGIDAVFVGPFDLSASMGHIGQPRHPEVRAAIEDVRRRCAARQLPIGIFATSPEGAADELAHGFGFVAIGSDLALFATAAAQTFKAARPR